MAKVEFTYQEVINALPRESRDSNSCGSAAAWQIFSTQEGADDAAVVINDTLVTSLTQPFEVKFGEVDGVAGRLSELVAERLRACYGRVYGWNDTEPRVELHYFVSRLFGNE